MWHLFSFKQDEFAKHYHRGENVMLLVRKLTAQIGAALTRADAALLLEGEWSEAVWREAFERAEGKS